MTAEPTLFRSKKSNRAVVPGWTGLVPERIDSIELQIEVKDDGKQRDQALLLIEYWKAPGEMALQSVLPMRAFSADPDGWCVFVPNMGTFMVRAIDPTPTPPQLSSFVMDLSKPQDGPILRLEVSFPAEAPANTPLLRPQA